VKKVIHALFSILAFAQPKIGDSVTVHVVASRNGSSCDVTHGDTSHTQQLTVLVDGRKYELESERPVDKAVVALGDYQAKLVADDQKPTREITRSYELVFPDRSTRKFKVVAAIEN
jgi:hypothetical protein